jgi:hypothetical protein
MIIKGNQQPHQAGCRIKPDVMIVEEKTVMSAHLQMQCVTSVSKRILAKDLLQEMQEG